MSVKSTMGTGSVHIIAYNATDVVHVATFYLLTR